MPLEIRAIRPDEVFTFRAALLRVFGSDAEPGEDDDALRRILDIDRAFAAFDAGEIVATAAALTLQLTVPGGSVPMAGLTMVTVQPSHRRRGLLRALMEEHLADVRRRGEPLSGLWASETSIYGRFGYGPATEVEQLTIDVRGARLDERPPSDEVRIVAGERLEAELVPIYERVRPARPGTLGRTEAWWRQRILREPKERAPETSKLRAAVSHRGSEPTGYVLYRQRPGWQKGLPDGKVDVVELLAVDGSAEATLWRLVCSIDLFPHVSWWNAPADTLLPWIVGDRRRVQRRRLDNLWLRPCDVPAALEARRYADDGELAIRIDDAVDPQAAGTFALSVQGGRARCERVVAGGVARAAELRTDAAGLGAMYLGAVRPALLCRAGRLKADPAALARAERMFSWPTAAWCPEVF